MHALGRCVPALALAVLLAGCAGSDSSNSGSYGTAATPTPATASPAAHRHRRRHRREPDVAVASVAPSVAPSGGSWPCNDQQFERDQQQFASGALQGDQEVDVCGTVTTVLPERETRSGIHGYYDLQVAPGDTIEIVCDLGEMDAPGWPFVKSGDYTYVQGRYYYDSTSSQGIDWTHHGTSRSWSYPGFVVVDGNEYQ